MDFSSTRGIDPEYVDVHVKLETVDLKTAFESQTDPDENLFYDIFSSAWNKKTVSQKLMLLARVAALAEAKAADLNVTASVEA